MAEVLGREVADLSGEETMDARGQVRYSLITGTRDFRIREIHEGAQAFSEVTSMLLVAGGPTILCSLLIGPYVSTTAQLAIGGVGALLVVLGCVLAKRGQQKKREASRLEGELERELAEMVGEDPLDWPAWVLNSKYKYLHAPAMEAVKRNLPDGAIPALAARADCGGTVRTQIAALKGVAPEGSSLEHAVLVPTRSELHTRHEKLSAEYGEYLCDPVRVLREPLLNDVTEPLTAAFVEDYAELTEMPDDVDPARHHQALSRAWKSWRAASAHARKTGTGTLGAEERKKVRTAQKLLEVALDPGATEAERASAYAQVRRLVSGLVDLPEEAVAAIEAKVRPALEA